VKKYQWAVFLWVISNISGQNLIDIRTQTKDVDFSGAASTIPAKTGTALPAVCNAGSIFFNVSSPPGQNLYSCEPANTWTLIGSSAVNGTISMAASGQFAFYAGSGNTVVGHSLSASDIPALNYQLPLVFTGNGAKTASSSGSLVANDCAQWDASGNIIDSGLPCAAIATGTQGQFGFYSTSGNTLTPHTLTATDIPALNYQAPLRFTGNGAETLTASAAGVANNCAKWDANGNVVDAGSPCGTGSGSGSSLSTPSATTVSNIPQYGNSTGTALSAGLGLVTTLGSPGLDTNIASEKAIRTAIAAATATSGQLPAPSVAGYLITNGTSTSWGDLVTGPTGALCAGTGCSGGTAGIIDINTAVLPTKTGQNTMTGVNKFSQLQVAVSTVSALLPCNSATEGQMAGVTDAASPSYLATVVGGGTVHVPVYCNGTNWVAH